MEVYHPNLVNGFLELPLGFGILNMGGGEIDKEGGFEYTGYRSSKTSKHEDFGELDKRCVQGKLGFFPDVGGRGGFAGPSGILGSCISGLGPSVGIFLRGSLGWGLGISN